jgi:hypothetical protein
MTKSPSAILLIVLALFHISCENADAQKVDMPSSAKQQVLSLNHTNNGQHLAPPWANR